MQMGATSPTHWWGEYAAHFAATVPIQATGWKRLTLCQRSCSKCGEYICFALAAYGKGIGLLNSGQALQWSNNWVACFHDREKVRCCVLRWTTKMKYAISWILSSSFHLHNQCAKHETQRSHWMYQCRRLLMLTCRIGPEVLQMVAWADFLSPSTCDWKAFWSCCWSNALNWRAEARLSSSFAFLAVRSDFLASAAATSVLFEYISLLCSSCSVDFICNHYRNHALIRCRYKFTTSLEEQFGPIWIMKTTQTMQK